MCLNGQMIVFLLLIVIILEFHRKIFDGHKLCNSTAKNFFLQCAWSGRENIYSIRLCHYRVK